MDRVVRTDKTTIRLTYIWIALSLYTGIGLLGNWFPVVGKITLRCLMLSVIAILVILATNIKWSGHQRDKVPYTLCVMLLLWMAIMYFTSGLQCLWWVNYITQYDFISYTWVWLLLIPQLPLFKSFLRVIEGLSWIGIALVILSFWKYTDNSYMQFLCEGFTLGAGLVVMTQRYHEKRINLLCYTVLILGFLTATIHARRNLMLTSGCYMMVGAAQLMFGSVIKSTGNRIIVTMTCIFTLLCCTGFYMVNDRGMFAKITGRFGDNTREYVFLHYFADFGMHPEDLITGRSMLGTYECPGVEGESGNDGQRGVVESGYLNTILKGGFIYLALYISIMAIAAKKGFKSANILGKAGAWMLVFQLIDMAYFGIHSFNLKSYMLWMVVAICLNNELMQKSDDEIRHLVYQPKPELPKWKRK